MIRFECSCGAKMKVDDKLAGKRGKCPTCGQAVMVPAASIDTAGAAPIETPTLTPAAGVSKPPAAGVARPRVADRTAATSPRPALNTSAAKPASITVAAAVTDTPRETASSKPVAAGKRRSPLLVAAVIAVLAGGAAFWKFNQTPKGDADARGKAATDTPDNRGAAGVVPAGGSPPAGTLPDGRFAPGRIKLELNVVSTIEVGNRTIVASSENYERHVVLAKVGNAIVAHFVDEKPPEKPPADIASDPQITAFQDIQGPAAAISPDGKRLAYILTVGRRKFRAVIDGVAGPEYRYISQLTFSPDSKRVAYGAQMADSKWAIVVDGKEHPTNWFSLVAIGFSPDSSRIAYAGGNDNGSDRAYNIVVDHKPWQGVYRWIPVKDARRMLPDAPRSPFHFSQDSSKVAMIASTRHGGPSSQVVAVDGQNGPEFSAIVQGTPVFSPDGARLLYGGFSGDTVALVENGRTLRTHTHVSWIKFSPDGKRLAYGIHHPQDPQSRVSYSVDTVYTSSRYVGDVGLVLDGVELPGRGGWDFTFNADGSSYAFVRPLDRDSSRFPDGGAEVVVNGKALEATHSARFLQFSQDGKHLAYLSSEAEINGARSKLVIDGVELDFPLRGEVVRMRFVGNDSLRMVTQSYSPMEIRVVDARLVPVVDAVAVTPATPGTAIAASPEAEAAVAKLKSIADAAAHDAGLQRSILRQIPKTYALFGDADAAVAADAAAPSEPKAKPSTMPFKPGVTLDMDEDDAPPDRQLKLLALALDVQLEKRDTAAAATTADRIEAIVRAIDNVTLPENAKYLSMAAAAQGRVGNVAKDEALRKMMPPARPVPGAPTLTPAESAAQDLLRSGDAAKAREAIAALPDAPSKVDLFTRLAGMRQRQADNAGAFELYRTAAGVASSPTVRRNMLGSPPMTLVLGLIDTGGDDAAVAAALAPLPGYQDAVSAGLHRTAASMIESGDTKRAARLAPFIADRTLAAELLTSIGQPERARSLLRNAVAEARPLAAREFTDFENNRAQQIRGPWHQYFMRVGTALARFGDRKEAAAAFAEAVSASAKWPMQEERKAALFTIVEHMTYAGLPANAIGLLKQLSDDLGPDSGTQLVRVAVMQADGGDIAGATASAEKVNVQYTSDRYQAWFAIGAAQLRAGNAAAAQASFDKAIAEFEKARGTVQRPAPYLALARAKGGDWAGAIKILDGPNVGGIPRELLSELAVLQAKAGDIDGAAATAGRADPNDRNLVLSTLAQEVLATGDYKASLRLWGMCGGMYFAPNNGQAVAAAIAAGDVDLALSHIGFGIHDDALKLADARARSGDTATARRIYNRLVDLHIAPGNQLEHLHRLLQLARSLHSIGATDDAGALLEFLRNSPYTLGAANPATNQYGWKLRWRVASEHWESAKAEYAIAQTIADLGDIDGLIAWGAAMPDADAKSQILRAAAEGLMADRRGADIGPASRRVD